jgi:hypothetical protein
MKVRRKPVQLDAMQLLNSNYDLVANWCNGLLIKRSDNFEPSIQIMSLEGIKTARLNDYIIKGYSGDFYPVPPHVFKETYEVINE